MSVAAAMRTIVSLALPPRCPGCGAIADDDHRFCADCWMQLDLLTAAGCALCNRPVAVAGLICGPCLADPPSHDGVLAAVAYGAVARTVVLCLKYGRQTGLARTIARALERHVDDRDAVLVPVPLHRRRLWSRGFNQAAAIAEALARRAQLRIERACLVRRRATPSLRGLAGVARRNAVRGAFRTTRRLDGVHVLLVDDVYTTGATANACAAVLKRAGAARVTVLCWARVIADD